MKNSLKSLLVVLSLLLPVAAQADGLHGKTLSATSAPSVVSVFSPIVTPCDEIDGVNSGDLDALMTVALNLATGNGSQEALYAYSAAFELRSLGLFDDSAIFAFLQTQLRLDFNCQ
jgi:hypothetical protein